MSKLQHRSLLALLSLGLLIALGAGCLEPEPEPKAKKKTPSLVIAGLHRVEIGGTLSLTAATVDGDDVSYTWHSADENLARVDGAGTVRGVGAGEVEITAEGSTTGATASHAVVVVPGPEATVSIAGTHRIPVGTVSTLQAITINGTDSNYAWQSDAPAVATVEGGVVTTLSVGEANISATGADTGAVGTFSIAVTGTSGVVITGPFAMQIGDDAQLVATTINEDDASYLWTTSDETVATVSDSGLLHARSQGSVTVTAFGVESELSGTIGVTIAAEIPNFDAWASSAHANRTDEPFNHWNAEGAVPTTCARCHSDGGFRDYIGDDGSAAGVVDAAAPIGTVVQCTTCHNPTADALNTVTFPSGAVVEGAGPSTRCMVCHQGRASSDTVDEAIVTAGLDAPESADQASASLNFINIHYFAAAATLEAGNARGAYQYPGQVYDVRFRHVPDRDICIECHDQHTLKVRLTTCQTCHPNAATFDDLKDIRMMSSLKTDYDGDGNRSEGIYYEMVGVRDRVLERMQAYGREQGKPICYNTDAYPYFFNDTNDDGECSSEEASFGNKYVSFTPRLLRASYNFQVASKDPGAFAHNAKYIIETLFDSATDLNNALTAPADLAALNRNDPGHFNGSGEPARHWDEDEDGVSASCSRCHGASEGYRFFLEYRVGEEVLEQGNGLDCATCHETFANVADPQDAFSVIALDNVWFPSQVVLNRPGDKGNLCAQCHGGRASALDVDAKIALGTPQTTVSPHYLPAAALKYSTAVKAGYEYAGNSYSGEWTDHLGGSSCVDCHSPPNTQHTMLIEDNLTRCQLCHVGVQSPEEIRTQRHAEDYDGDGDTNEPLEDELSGIASALLTQMHTVAPQLCYAEHGYYKDTNNSGPLCDDSEVYLPTGGTDSSKRFKTNNPALLKAEYNYMLWNNEPGAWAHNFDYAAQLMIDAIDDLGGDSTALIRPTP